MIFQCFLGGWGTNPKQRNCGYKVNNAGNVEYNGPLPKARLELLALLQPERNDDDSIIPSREYYAYWIRAPFNENTLPRLPNITCNSGKFLVFLPLTFAKNQDQTWVALKKEYAEGKLGYAIQCSATESPNDNHTSKGLITVHTEDAFDLEQITSTAYEILKALHTLDPNYEGVIQYLTDRSTRAKAHPKPIRGPECHSLYSISSRSYLQNPKNITDKTPKKLELFQQILYPQLTEKAQDRQDFLRYKKLNFSNN